MKDNNAYLKQGKWKSDRVYKILTNSIYIGVFEYGKYKTFVFDLAKCPICGEIMSLSESFIKIVGKKIRRFIVKF